MRCETREMIVPVIVALSVLAMAMMSASVVDAAPDREYDQDLGEMYSMKVGFVFTGSDAETIEWDFGDGSEPSTEMNPCHVYAEKGEYIVTQTTWNSYQGGSTTVMKFRIQVMGYPVISFECNGGTPVSDIEQEAYNVPASEPGKPVRPGFEFLGWFADKECTEPFDWNTCMIRHMTLYAGWTESELFTVTFDVSGGSINMDPLRVEPNGSIEVPSYTGVREGFSFDCWSLNGEKVVPGSTIVVDSDIVLTALWTQNEEKEGSEGGIIGAIAENPAVLGAAVAAIVAGLLIAVRAGRS